MVTSWIWKSDAFLAAAVKTKFAHRFLAVWAADCAERVLPGFEREFPDDDRPRTAIAACRRWARTGIFKMADVRRDSLAAHAAARQADEDTAARFAARAAGQAIATAHVADHASGAADYALKAMGSLPRTGRGANLVERERKWQSARLRKLLRSIK